MVSKESLDFKSKRLTQLTSACAAESFYYF